MPSFEVWTIGFFSLSSAEMKSFQTRCWSPGSVGVLPLATLSVHCVTSIFSDADYKLICVPGVQAHFQFLAGVHLMWLRTTEVAHSSTWLSIPLNHSVTCKTATDSAHCLLAIFLSHPASSASCVNTAPPRVWDKIAGSPSFHPSPYTHTSWPVISWEVLLSNWCSISILQKQHCLNNTILHIWNLLKE